MTRDEVIKALELCRYDPDPGQEPKSMVSCDICPYWSDKFGCRMTDMFNDALALLKEEPKHGHWFVNSEHDRCEWACSECGYEPTVFEYTPYCPNCGAMMEVEDNAKTVE